MQALKRAYRKEPSRKNILKIFQKGIDKGKTLWYNSQAVRETDGKIGH